MNIALLRIKPLLIYGSVFLFNTKLNSRYVLHLYRGEWNWRHRKRKKYPL